MAALSPREERLRQRLDALEQADPVGFAAAMGVLADSFLKYLATHPEAPDAVPEQASIRTESVA